MGRGGYCEDLEAEPPAAEGQWGSGGEASSRRKLRVWRQSPDPPEARGLGTEPLALGDFSTKITHF